ncbi:MAG: M3 family oligoendopeptidase [Deltaproteobacteria bacterium]|nr:M3 family oligoendopeptidase [Deltaproteobacteria bacterium]TLN01837.1 MAG: M3 family oligoendopeptidase [bacterium]
MNDLQEKYTWDTSLLYLSPDSPGLQEDFSKALEHIKDFRGTYLGKVSALDGENLKKALTELEAIYNHNIKLHSYSYLIFAADSTDAENQKLSQRGIELTNKAEQELFFFELEINSIPEDKFLSLARSKHLQQYRHYLQGLRKFKPHMLSEQEERLLKQKSLTGIEAFTRLFEELTSSFSFLMEIEGKEKEVTGEELLGLLHHEDATVREKAFTIFLSRFRKESITFSTIINTVALDHHQEWQLRSYSFPMEPTHLANELSNESVASLMETTERNYPLAQAYFQLKARILGCPKLKNTDIYAPIGKTDKQYSFTQAREMVLASYSEFNPDFQEIIANFFSQKRIDAFPRPGKSGGAFCMGISPSLPPYVLMNFTGNLRDVATLAHELGHGLHYVLAQNKSMLNYHPPLPLAETASVFGEMLLTRSLLKKETDPAVRIALLCAQIEDIIATTFRQNVLTRFEERIHNCRAQGLLSAQEICDIWWEENAALYGNAVDMIEPYRWGWSYISHFIHSRFYCYSYTFAELLVLALFQKYLSTGDAFVPIFTGILESGGALSPAETVRSAGINLSDSNFWQEGYDLLGGMIEELERLL